MNSGRKTETGTGNCFLVFYWEQGQASRKGMTLNETLLGIDS